MDEPVQGLPPLVNLFDTVVHPDFSENQLIFVAYFAKDAGGLGLEVLRARLVGNRLADIDTVFRATPKSTQNPMSGGRMLFRPDGTLLISVGDLQDGNSSAQDSSTHFGSVVRIADSGSAPVDNPFLGDSAHLPEIYTLGHRNIQGMAIDSVTSEIWVSEHGPVGRDELNVLSAGTNYGWAAVRLGIEEDPLKRRDEATEVSYENPVHTWTPAVAPSGLAVYRSKKHPDWDGSVFLGSLAGCYVLRIHFDADRLILSQEKLLEELGARIRDVRVGPDEEIYILTDELDGKLIRIAPINTDNAPSDDGTS